MNLYQNNEWLTYYLSLYQNKLLLESQTKKMELEASLEEMEKMATQQMKSLARESEEALETAKEKLREIHVILQAYQRFVRVSVSCYKVRIGLNNRR